MHKIGFFPTPPKGAVAALVLALVLAACETTAPVASPPQSSQREAGWGDERRFEANAPLRKQNSQGGRSEGGASPQLGQVQDVALDAAAQPQEDDTKGPDASTLVCLTAAQQAEIKYDIPKGLLQAVLIERANGMMPQPFALDVNARGLAPALRGAPSSPDAVSNIQDFATVELALDEAKKNRHNATLRVGCGLLKYQRHAKWLTLDLTFDAKQNVQYLARYIVRLKKKHGSWTKAVGESWSDHAWNHKRFVELVAERMKMFEPSQGWEPSTPAGKAAP